LAAHPQFLDPDNCQRRRAHDLENGCRLAPSHGRSSERTRTGGGIDTRPRRSIAKSPRIAASHRRKPA
jgi:hypothetical protein